MFRVVHKMVLRLIYDGHCDTIVELILRMAKVIVVRFPQASTGYWKPAQSEHLQKGTFKAMKGLR